MNVPRLDARARPANASTLRQQIEPTMHDTMPSTHMATKGVWKLEWSRLNQLGSSPSNEIANAILEEVLIAERVVPSNATITLAAKAHQRMSQPPPNMALVV